MARHMVDQFERRKGFAAEVDAEASRAVGEGQCRQRGLRLSSTSQLPGQSSHASREPAVVVVVVAVRLLLAVVEDGRLEPAGRWSDPLLSWSYCIAPH
jgi:hypothetical protein